MRVQPKLLLASVLAGCTFASAKIFAGIDAFQESDPPVAQETSRPDGQTASNPTRKSGWRHFGSSPTDKAPATPVGSGSWRHFGPKVGGNGVPKALTPKVATVAAPKVASAAPSRAPTHAPVPLRRVSSSRIAQLEREMVEIINRDRSDPRNTGETKGRALPLRWNEKLAAIARAHSRDMVQRRFFDHVDPDGKSGGERVMAAGIPWQSTGENIAMYGDVAAAEAAFMNEPRFEHNHRGNILNPKYTEIGVGIAQGPDGQYYITQDFVESPARSQGPGEGSTRLTPRQGSATSPSPAE